MICLNILCAVLQLSQRSVTGIQWVASEAWVTATLLTSPQFQPLLEGTLGFSFPGVSIPGLKEFLLNVRPSPQPGMEFINMFWEELFDCKLPFNIERSKENSNIINRTIEENYNGPTKKSGCTGFENLSGTVSSYTDVARVRISYNVYKAVYAISHALHRLLNCDSAEHKGMCEVNATFTSAQASQCRN